jgi:hypothetical protein
MDLPHGLPSAFFFRRNAMSIAAIIAVGLLSGALVAAGAFVLARKIKAHRQIWKDEGDLLRFRLWNSTR